MLQTDLCSVGRFEEILTKYNVIKRTSRLKTTFEEVEKIIKISRQIIWDLKVLLGSNMLVKLWDFIVLKPILLYYWHQLFIFRGTNDQLKKMR